MIIIEGTTQWLTKGRCDRNDSVINLGYTLVVKVLTAITADNYLLNNKGDALKSFHLPNEPIVRDSQCAILTLNIEKGFLPTSCLHFGKLEDEPVMLLFCSTLLMRWYVPLGVSTLSSDSLQTKQEQQLLLLLILLYNRNTPAVNSHFLLLANMVRLRSLRRLRSPRPLRGNKLCIFFLIFGKKIFKPCRFNAIKQ